MKKSIYIVCLVFSIFLMNACRDKSSTATGHHNQDTSAHTETEVPVDTTEYAPAAAAVAEEQQFDYADSVDFKKYAVEIPSESVKAKIDWSSDPDSKTFISRIKEAYKLSEVNFAGHYIGVTFGCGAECIFGYMVDIRDGKIYSLPLGETNSCSNMQGGALYEAGSTLFISAVCKNDPASSKVEYIAYLWNEENKRFDPVEEKGKN